MRLKNNTTQQCCEKSAVSWHSCMKQLSIFARKVLNSFIHLVYKELCVVHFARMVVYERLCSGIDPSQSDWCCWHTQSYICFLLFAEINYAVKCR